MAFFCEQSLIKKRPCINISVVADVTAGKTLSTKKPNITG